ncbi:MAG: WYL domain-containing protein, partial [Alistipes sp.]|nr:WYL domain-containing protein [Alistipes sp.]
LYSVYDNKILADTIVRGNNAATVHALIEAIESEQQVILHDYRSSHGGVVRDRRVEPFAFTTNYVQVWCYDTESHSCKLFKLSRITSVEILNQPWQHKADHRKGHIDIFRMNGEKRHRIRLELGMLSRNLLLEEYPLAEEHITAIDAEHWLLDTEVASYAGVGRFVVGLMDDIRIIDTPELEEYLAGYVTRYWPQATEK